MLTILKFIYIFLVNNMPCSQIFGFVFGVLLLDNSLYVLRILTEVTKSLPVKAKSVSLLLVMNKGTVSSSCPTFWFLPN